MRLLELRIPTKEELTALAEAYQSTRDVRLHLRMQMVLLAVEHHMTAAAYGGPLCQDRK